MEPDKANRKTILMAREKEHNFPSKAYIRRTEKGAPDRFISPLVCLEGGYAWNIASWPKPFPHIGKALGFDNRRLIKLCDFQTTSFFKTMHRPASEDEAGALFSSAARNNATASYLVGLGFAGGFLASRWSWTRKLRQNLKTARYGDTKIMGISRMRGLFNRISYKDTGGMWDSNSVLIRHLLCGSLGALAGKAVADTTWTMDEWSNPVLNEYYTKGTHWQHQLRGPFLHTKLPQLLPLVAPLLGLGEVLYRQRLSESIEIFEALMKRGLESEELEVLFWQTAKQMQLESYGKAASILAGTYFAIVRTLPFRQTPIIATGFLLARGLVYGGIGWSLTDWTGRLYRHHSAKTDPRWRAFHQTIEDLAFEYLHLATMDDNRWSKGISLYTPAGIASDFHLSEFLWVTHPWYMKKRYEVSGELLERDITDEESWAETYAFREDEMICSYTIPIGALIALWRTDGRVMAVRTAGDVLKLMARGSLYMLVAVSLARHIGLVVNMHGMRNDARLNEWVAACETGEAYGWMRDPDQVTPK